MNNMSWVTEQIAVSGAFTDSDILVLKNKPHRMKNMKKKGIILRSRNLFTVYNVIYTFINLMTQSVIT